MKKHIAFLGAAAAALMMAGTAHAESGGGYVGLSYSDNNDSDINSWAVNGAFAAGENVQIDAGYSRLSGSGDADAFNIGGHFFSRGPQWLWGGFVGYDRISGGGADVDEWTVAGQTQYYMDRSTISGDLSYSSASLFGTDIHTTQIDGEARFFATDNFSIQGNVGYANVDGSGSTHFWSYGVGAEWKPDSMPLSFTAGLEGWNGEGTSTSAWTIGARYTWGGTLLERNRSGAGLNEPHGFLALIF